MKHSDSKRDKNGHRATLRKARLARQSERDFFAAQH